MKRPEEIEGLVPESTGNLLRRLAGEVPVGRVVVEIGAFKGKSTAYLADGVREGVRVYSIDPHGLEGSERGRGGRFAGDDVRAEYLANLEGYLDRVDPVRALSREAPVPEEPIGLLWIDGAHDLISVAGDVDRWASRVAPGGFLVIDDFGTWHPGVDAVVRELQKDRRWTAWVLSPKPLAWARRAES